MKQAALTYAGGKGARYLAGADKSLMPFQGGGMDEYTMANLRSGPLGRFVPEARQISDAGKIGPTGSEIHGGTRPGRVPSLMETATEATIGKIPILGDKLPKMVQQQLLVGGITAGASALASFLAGDFRPQEEGELLEDYLAARKQSVGKQMRTYMDNYFTYDPEYSALDDAGRDAFVARYNVAQGGRIGFQTGGISMANTLAQNRAINNARRAANQAVLQGARNTQQATNILDQMGRNYDFSGLSQYGLSPKTYDSTPGPMRGIPAVGNTRSRMIKDLASKLPKYAAPVKTSDQLIAEQVYKDLGGGIISAHRAPVSDLSAAHESRITNEAQANMLAELMAPGSTAPPQQYTKPSFQEALRGDDWNMLSDIDQYRISQEYPGQTPPRRNPDFEPGLNQGGRVGYAIGSPEKQLEAGAPPIIYEGNMDPRAQNQRTGLPSIPGPIRMARDGPEFDMRQRGGFQPLGRQEGKDDVPAMLAKNEFVMTADAVRAAGGGSINKGAQRMYDTMKKLERRVS